jgi:hypothetical protein
MGPCSLHALEKRTPTNPKLAHDDTMTQGEQSMSSPSPPTLCDHRRPCPPIPSTMEPSPALWSPILMEHHHAGPCAAQMLPSARLSNWRMDRDQVYALGELPSKLLPGEYKAATTPAGTKICQDAVRS